MNANKFKQARLNLNLTQSELAQKLGLGKGGQVHISNIERGIKKPSKILLKALELLIKNNLIYPID